MVGDAPHNICVEPLLISRGPTIRIRITTPIIFVLEDAIALLGSSQRRFAVTVNRPEVESFHADS